MSAFSAQLEQNILNWLKGNVMPSSPISLVIALHTSDPLDDFSGGGEVTGGGYARQPVTFGGLIDTGVGTKIQNDAIIKFPPVSAATSGWGSVSHWSIHANDNSQFLFHGDFQNIRTILTGGNYIITTQELELTILNSISQQLQQNILNWAVKNTTMPTAPTGLLVALHNNNPLYDFSGGGEVAGGGYTRQSINFGSLTSINGIGTTIQNTTIPFFGPANSSWGDISHLSLHSSSGQYLFFGQFASIKSIETGESIDIKASNMSLKLR